MKTPNETRALRPLPNLIFASRWLQLPLYLGLIVAQAIYVWLFWQELYYLLMATFGDGAALSHILDSVTVEGAKRPTKPNETVVFSYIVFKSRKHRDKVNAKVMKDPIMNDPKWQDMPMPFQMDRMAYGGFEVIVE
jgi:hypothetical protein